MSLAAPSAAAPARSHSTPEPQSASASASPPARSSSHVNGHDGAHGSPGLSAASVHVSLQGSPGSAAPGGPAHRPTFLECPNPPGYRFLIMDAPNDQNLPSYLDVLRKRQVVVVTRVCDPTYSCATLHAQGIKVLDIPFADGDPPPPHVIDRWLDLVDQVFKHGCKDVTGNGLELNTALDKPAIGIHCVAGLGRAPVMVAIALVEAGMDRFDAIALIRKKRRGALNSRQLKFIENYEPRRRAKGCCTVQ